MKKILTILMAFAVMFTGFGFEASAASLPQPKTKVSGTNVTLSWKKLSSKQQKKITGIAVFRNGKRVKRLSKTATSFSESIGYNNNVKYQIKTYKNKKVKKWYNKKSKKWQTKKPKKKYRGKSKKFTVAAYKAITLEKSLYIARPHTKKTEPSNARVESETTPGGTTTGGTTTGGTTGGTTTGGNAASMDTTTYFDFGSTRIYMGQEWTSLLQRELASQSNGTEVLRRTFTGVKSMDVYMFNTNTYEPFLAVMVVDGKICEWLDNAENLGTLKGQTFVRDCSYNTVVDTAWIAGFKFSNGVRFVRISSPDVDWTKIAISGSDDVERTICFHTINAVRVAYGRSILIRNTYLEGVDLQTGKNKTYTGTIDFFGEKIEITNGRYGAQAWAETMAASRKVSHEVDDMTAGPCLYGYSDTVQSTAAFEETGKILSVTNELCTTGTGVDAVLNYGTSGVHRTFLMDAEQVYIGIGCHRGSNGAIYNCVILG